MISSFSRNLIAIQDDGITYKLEGVTMTAGTEFKVRLGHNWDNNYGVGGVAGGLRPFLPKIVRDEIDAGGKVSAAIDGELRKAIAKTCAVHIHDYLARNLPRIVDETGVWCIIYDSIMALDEDKMEFLTRQIANRELRGITIWGGVIGAAVGVATSFVIRMIG